MGYSCGWCNNTKHDERHNEWCQRPQIIEAGSMGRTPLLQLRLNEYQAANLHWLLNLTMSEEPFSAAHTGDWTGEVLNMLEEHEDYYNKYDPNDTDNEAIREAKRWALAVKIIDS